MRWLFVGAGNMAGSLIGGLLNGGTDTQHIAVVDPDEQAQTRASDAFGIHATDTASTAIELLRNGADGSNSQLVIVLAVKPHIVEPACKALSAIVEADNTLHDNVVYVSVAAGVRLDNIQSWLPQGSALVRCMPNTPALLGLGITALYANTHCSQANKSSAQMLLDNAGKTLWVDNEESLDAVTAVSGSGPAYFFYLIEHMSVAGVQLGLTKETAETLAIETAFGAASMARARAQSPAELRENVTSKGGTTAAALNTFNAHDTPTIIKKALQAAHDRAKELGDEIGSR